MIKLAHLVFWYLALHVIAAVALLLGVTLWRMFNKRRIAPVPMRLGEGRQG